MLMSALLGGCFGVLSAVTGAIYDPAAAQAQVDAAILAQVNATRASYEASPSCVSAHQWAMMTQSAIDGGLYTRGALTISDIDAAIAALPESGADAWMCLADRGMLFASTARPAEAKAALEKSLVNRQTPYALNVLLPLAPEEAATRCKAAYGAQKSDSDRLLVLDVCAPYDPSLAWAPAAARSLYRDEQAARQAEAEARAKAEADRQAAEAAAAAQRQTVTTAPTSSSGASSSSPAAPTVTSVRLHNSCSKTVRLFYGDKPKYGSGTYSTLGANTTESRTFQPGDMIWIVDESQNGISSISVGGASMNVEITSSCTGFRAN